MSRSKKQPFVKDRKLRKYWKIVRQRQKQDLRTEKEVISNPKEVVNDWDWRDWRDNFLGREEEKKHRRK